MDINTTATAVITCGCSATQDAIAHGVTTHEEAGRCVGCGTPVEAKRQACAANFTDLVTEYGITVGNPFKVF